MILCCEILLTSTSYHVIQHRSLNGSDCILETSSCPPFSLQLLPVHCLPFRAYDKRNQTRMLNKVVATPELPVCIATAEHCLNCIMYAVWQTDVPSSFPDPSFFQDPGLRTCYTGEVGMLEPHLGLPEGLRSPWNSARGNFVYELPEVLWIL